MAPDNPHTKKVKKSRYDRLKADGRCVGCLQPARPGRTRCESCGEIARAARKLQTERHRADGLCLHCGEKAVNGRSLCQAHLDAPRLARAGLQVTYSERVDAAYVYLAKPYPGMAKRTVQVPGLDINIDLDADGRVLGLEFLRAGKTMPADLLAAFNNQPQE